MGSCQGCQRYHHQPGSPHAHAGCHPQYQSIEEKHHHHVVFYQQEHYMWHLVCPRFSIVGFYAFFQTLTGGPILSNLYSTSSTLHASFPMSSSILFIIVVSPTFCIVTILGKLSLLSSCCCSCIFCTLVESSASSLRMWSEVDVSVCYTRL